MNTRRHELKCWRPYFAAVASGAKTAELRHNDRHFKAGHEILLQEWNRQTRTYTGASILLTITHVATGTAVGIPNGYALLSTHLA